jgi:hypothetical protein
LHDAKKGSPASRAAKIAEAMTERGVRLDLVEVAIHSG